MFIRAIPLYLFKMHIMFLEMLVNLSDVIMVVIALVVVGFVIYYVTVGKKNNQTPALGATANEKGKRFELEMMAYERLTLLAERIALPSLISRLNDSSISARDMQLLLNDAIRQEFEHNISQQIYVTPEAWMAVKNLKEQNQYAVNQIGAVMPPNATGLDLNKQILEFVGNHPKGNLHTIVQEVLSYEAKQQQA
jgi:hypothetical protein